MVSELGERAVGPATGPAAGRQVIDDAPELQQAEIYASTLSEAHALRAARGRGALRPSQVSEHDLRTKPLPLVRVAAHLGPRKDANPLYTETQHSNAGFLYPGYRGAPSTAVAATA